MTFSIRQIPRVLILAAFLVAIAHAGDDITWRPVTPAEIQMTTPKVEADADAEAIFWEVKLDDKKLNSVYYEHYVRVKIFTELGREKFSKFEIPFAKGKKIENLAARVIKPDGTILLLDPADIFDREIVKVEGFKVMAKSFAFPGVEPGAIVEYQYKEVYKNAWSSGVRLTFQRDIPVQRLSYYVRPQKGFGLRFKYFNMPETKFVEDPSEKGFYVATVNNVPSYKTEPYMPPEDEVRRWAQMSYSLSDIVYSPWGDFNRKYAPWLYVYAKPTTLIKAKAAELTANAATDDAKLRRIYDFVQKKIRNVDYDDALSDDDREKLTFDHAEDALKAGMGNSIYIELLFASLAKASGMEANLVFASDRSQNFFHPDKYPFPSFLRLSGVAIKMDTEWRYFNVSRPYMPYGFLPWNREGVNAMLIGEEGFIWQRTPYTGQGMSSSRRTAKLTLTEDGELEGTLRFEYYGQEAITRRGSNFRSSQAHNEETVKDEIKARISTAEVSDITVENMSDDSKALTYTCKIKVPGYAQRTGKRLFVQPGVFEYGSKNVFSASARSYGIYFSFPWSEHDYVEIQLPKGFELESADQPGAVADPKKIGADTVLMNYDKSTGLLKYKRDFFFGDNGGIMFPVDYYTGLKDLFDAFHKADTHMLTLRPAVN